MNKAFNRAIKVWMTMVYSILFIPILIIIMMSFNKTDYGFLPFEFTFEWYKYLFTRSELLPATFLTLKLAGGVALVSVVLGTITALGVDKFPKRVQKFINSVVQLPIIIPWLVQGIALLLLLNYTGLGRSYAGMFFGNLIVVLPYVIMMVSGRFAGADKTPKDAARMLGAKPVRVFFDVTLPELLPGIISGGLMAFMVCFNAFVMQYYLAPFGVNTLPMEIFTLVRTGYKADLNALATILILSTTIIVLVLNKLGYSTRKMFNL